MSGASALGVPLQRSKLRAARSPSFCGFVVAAFLRLPRSAGSTRSSSPHRVLDSTTLTPSREVSRNPPQQWSRLNVPHSKVVSPSATFSPRRTKIRRPPGRSSARSLAAQFRLTCPLPSMEAIILGPCSADLPQDFASWLLAQSANGTLARPHGLDELGPVAGFNQPQWCRRAHDHGTLIRRLGPGRRQCNEA